MTSSHHDFARRVKLQVLEFWSWRAETLRARSILKNLLATDVAYRLR